VTAGPRTGTLSSTSSGSSPGPYRLKTRRSHEGAKRHVEIDTAFFQSSRRRAERKKRMRRKPQEEEWSPARASNVTILLLPGMDGGAALSERFRKELSLDFAANVLTYAPDQVAGYGDLEPKVRAVLSESSARVALIAESFSGPLAIRIAAAPPPSLRCVVLVATFAHSPAPRFLGSLVGSPMFRKPPPAFVVRRLMLGKDATDEEVAKVQEAIRRVEAPVLANRLRAVMSVDVTSKLSSINIPCLYLRPTEDRLVRRPLTIPTGSNWEDDAIAGPHLILQHRPAECAERIARFIRERA